MSEHALARITAHARPDSLGYSAAASAMHEFAVIARALAQAFAAGPLEVDRLVECGVLAVGRRRWLRSLAVRIAAAFADKTRPRDTVLAEFILADRRFLRACEHGRVELLCRGPTPAAMSPIAAASGWRLPSIETPGKLAEWLGVTCQELDWLADRRAWESRQRFPRSRHYHYRALLKRRGSYRMIEAPKPRLKAIQRRILAEVLNRIPAHRAAHGFRPGRSIATFAAPHVGQAVVLRLDLGNFFPSIRVARIEAIFRAAGYPQAVADILASLCTNATPLDVWDADDATRDRGFLDLQRLYAQPHLPQGAPTSPALANLVAFRLDRRLTGLAESAHAEYTRYADDLAFSGGPKFARRARRFGLHVVATALEEGFAVLHRKTRLMRAATRQKLAGIVVNQRLNVPRSDFDQLKAILTNCVRLGPASQNRDSRDDFRGHLLGRIAFVASIHAARGERLRELFERIRWD